MRMLVTANLDTPEWTAKLVSTLFIFECILSWPAWFCWASSFWVIVGIWSLLWSLDTCLNNILVHQYHVTISRFRGHRGRVFFEVFSYLDRCPDNDFWFKRRLKPSLMEPGTSLLGLAKSVYYIMHSFLCRYQRMLQQSLSKRRDVCWPGECVCL